MPDLLSTTLITRVDGLLATEVDGETVLMHVDWGQYYGLARTALVIWELFEAPHPFEPLCAALQVRNAGAPEVIAANTRRLVSKMAAAEVNTPGSRQAVREGAAAHADARERVRAGGVGRAVAGGQRRHPH